MSAAITEQYRGEPEKDLSNFRVTLMILARHVLRDSLDFYAYLSLVRLNVCPTQNTFRSVVNVYTILFFWAVFRYI